MAFCSLHYLYISSMVISFSMYLVFCNFYIIHFLNYLMIDIQY